MKQVMSTISKPKTLHLREIPLLVDREWVRHHVGIGTTKIIELEKTGVITPVVVPGLRNKKYRSAELLKVLGLSPNEEAAA